MNTENTVQTSAVPRAEVEEYIRLHSQAAVIDKRMEELKKTLLPALVSGAATPFDLPYLLINRPQTRKQPDWKGYVRLLLLKLYKRRKDAEALADAELTTVDAGWPLKTFPALHVVENPEYSADLTTIAS
jgi:hypothetical protein